MADIFQVIFLAMLALSTALRIWLSLRQMKHVAAHRSTVPADFAASISLADHYKGADYTCAKLRYGLVHVVADTLLLLLLTFGGLLTFIDQIVHRTFSTGTYSHGLTLFAIFALVGFCADLPFLIYRTFVLEARFGFNKITPGLFVVDLLKQLLLSAIIGGPLLLLVLWVMNTVGSYWWFWVWLVWLGFNLLTLLLYPTFIAPLFNKFSPLAEGEMKSRIEALLTRCGFASSGLFVMDGSKRSAHGNAYFTGFGKAKRIVFFDTLLEKLSPGEVEAVLAHELGHYKRQHVWKRIGIMSAATLALLGILGQLIDQPWFYAGLKVGAGDTASSTAMALILFSLVLPVFTFPFKPVLSWLSRRDEFEADAYAAQQASGSALIDALLKLYRDNAATLTPDPLHSLFYDSHPPATVRIAHLRAC